MEINFKGPVIPVDPYSQMAFVEILNILHFGMLASRDRKRDNTVMN